MISPERPEEVLDLLGDKFLGAVGSAVRMAREDIQTMRAWRPDWFVNMHPRTLADLIHDRIWNRLVVLCADDPRVVLLEHGPTREIAVGIEFVIRIKRHDASDQSRSYNTRTDLSFWAQGLLAPTLPGLDLVTLAIGYRWDPELRAIGAALVSFRTAKTNPVWSVELDEPLAGAAPITWTVVPPSVPDIFIGDAEDEQEQGAGGA